MSFGVTPRSAGLQEYLDEMVDTERKTVLSVEQVAITEELMRRLHKPREQVTRNYDESTPNGMICHRCSDPDSASEQIESANHARDQASTGSAEFKGVIHDLYPPREDLFRICQEKVAHLDAHHKYCIHLAIFFHHDITSNTIRECYEFSCAPPEKWVDDKDWMMNRKIKIQKGMIDEIHRMVKTVVHHTNGRAYWINETTAVDRRRTFAFFFDQHPLAICWNAFHLLRNYVDFERIWSVSDDTLHVDFWRWFCKNQILDLCEATFFYFVRPGVEGDKGREAVRKVWAESPGRLLEKYKDRTLYPYLWKDVPTGRIGSQGAKVHRRIHKSRAKDEATADEVSLCGYYHPLPPKEKQTTKKRVGSTRGGKSHGVAKKSKKRKNGTDGMDNDAEWDARRPTSIDTDIKRQEMNIECLERQLRNAQEAKRSLESRRSERH